MSQVPQFVVINNKPFLSTEGALTPVTPVTQPMRFSVSEFLVKNLPELSFLESEEETAQTLQMPTSGYHSILHALGVAQLAYSFGEHEGLDSLHLAVAGLFHDAGHSCDASVEDSVNINESCLIFQKFYSDFLSETKIVESKVLDLIQSTLSSRTPDDSFSEEERVMYDADTLDGLARVTTSSQLAQYKSDLLSEGYKNPGNPDEFAQIRGIYSQGGKEFARIYGVTTES